MKQIAFAEFRDHLSRYLVEAVQDQIIITKHGKPAGVLNGFATEDDWFDFQLENDSRFLQKVAESRAHIQAGRGISWDQVKQEDDKRASRRRRHIPYKSR